MYIVTGAAGLIGSGIVWGLNRRGVNEIITVDSLGLSDKWKNLRALRFAEYEEKEDFRDMIQDGTFDNKKIDAIIHMGACSATTEKDAAYLVDNNYKYTQELASFAVSHGIRFIYASSCATYGDGSLGYEDDESRLEQLRPMNMYGYSKHLFDLWAKNTGLLTAITGMKFSNVYGPNEMHKGEMRSVVCRAYEQISAGGKMALFKSYRKEYADGEQMRDFIYIKDVVDMVLFMLDRQDACGIYNIGSGRAETWNALAAAAFEAMDKPVNIEYIDMPENLRDRYQYYTKAEIGKLRALGYDKEVTSLKDAIADYIRNYRL
ncbi:MAG: ADP-glyceromanno-heptose 6-epimerase, partial [Victivallaceae bacterium]|nr:ADP-glyceromanno-heptose 6-epimerase [Victivallaceae bacterium]